MVRMAKREPELAGRICWEVSETHRVPRGTGRRLIDEAMAGHVPARGASRITIEGGRLWWWRQRRRLRRGHGITATRIGGDLWSLRR